MRNSMSGSRGLSQHSLVFRFTYALTALVWVSVLAVCFSAYGVQKSMGERMIDHLVETEALRLQIKKSQEDDTWRLAFERQLGPTMRAWGESKAVSSVTMPSVLRTLPLGLRHMHSQGRAWHVMVVEARDGRLYVAYDSSDAESLTEKFAWALLAIALFFMVLSYFLARVLARWAVLPIQTVTAHLTRWAPGRPSMFGLTSNEGVQLTEAFNKMQDRIDQTLADQKELSSNFNHEVRTPLTLIRTDAELGKLEAAFQEKAALRFERIMRSADEITESLEAVYYLAQASHGQTEPTSLRDCVNDVFTSAASEAESRDLVLHNQVDEAHIELVNRHMLLTVIRNIVRNAIFHAAPGTLEINSAGHGLAFSDDGPGVSPSDAPHLFDRYYSTRRLDVSSGDVPGALCKGEAGLGLAIAKRVCVVQGWDLEIASSARRGKGLTLLLSFAPPK